MKPKDNEVKCEQNRRDCISNKDGFCIALEDTKFKRQCPFYKRKEGKT